MIRNSRAFWFLGLGLLLLLFLIPLLPIITKDTAYQLDETIESSSIKLWMDRSEILFPSDCVHLRWELDGIQGVWLNERGQAGYGAATICNPQELISLRVRITADLEQNYELPISCLYTQPFYLLCMIAIIIIVLLLLYLSFGIIPSLALLAFVLILPLMAWNTHAASNFIDHIFWAAASMDSGDLRTLPPHFLFHITTIALASITNSPVAQAAAFNLALMQALLVVFIYLSLKTLLQKEALPLWWQIVLALFSLGLVFVGSLDWPLTQSFAFRIKSGLIYPNLYHSPTYIMLRPFAMLLFLLLIRLHQGQARQTWLYLLGIGLSTILATLAKPNYTIVIVPAYFSLLALQLLFQRKLPKQQIFAALILLITASIALAWQYFYTYGAEGAYVGYENTHILIEPFRLFREWQIGLVQAIQMLFLSIVFPLAVYVLYGKSALQNAPLNLAWIAFAGSLAVIHLFVEVPGTANGNFLWTAEIALLLLFISSVGFLLQKSPPSLSALCHDWRFLICLCLFTAHLINHLMVLV